MQHLETAVCRTAVGSVQSTQQVHANISLAAVVRTNKEWDFFTVSQVGALLDGRGLDVSPPSSDNGEKVSEVCCLSQ
jgi:hypothetical protein